MAILTGPHEAVAALATLWQSAVGTGVPVQVGAFSDVLPRVLCSVAVGDYDSGGITVEPDIDDHALGYVSTYTIRCMVTVFRSDRDWTLAATEAAGHVDALRSAIGSDTTLGGLVIQSAMLGTQQWHIDPHAADGGSAGVEFEVTILAQE